MPDSLVDTYFPALLRHGQAVYAAVINRRLAEEGYGDIPRHGIQVLGAVHAGRTSLGSIIDELRFSKQAMGQLVDTLAARGYVERRIDADDRRRVTVSLTERGKAAVQWGEAALELVDEALERAVGTAQVRHCRLALATLANLPPDDIVADAKTRDADRAS